MTIDDHHIRTLAIKERNKCKQLQINESSKSEQMQESVIQKQEASRLTLLANLLRNGWFGRAKKQIQD